jgi:hypothetical protein
LLGNVAFDGWALRFQTLKPRQAGNVNEVINGRRFTTISEEELAVLSVLAMHQRHPPTIMHLLRSVAFDGSGLRSQRSPSRRVGNVNKVTSGRLATTTYSRVEAAQLALT